MYSFIKKLSPRTLLISVGLLGAFVFTQSAVATTFISFGVYSGYSPWHHWHHGCYWQDCGYYRPHFCRSVWHHGYRDAWGYWHEGYRVRWCR